MPFDNVDNTEVFASAYATIIARTAFWELDEDEKEAIRRVLSDDWMAQWETAGSTVANDPELADRAEKLKQRLGGA